MTATTKRVRRGRSAWVWDDRRLCGVHTGLPAARHARADRPCGQSHFGRASVVSGGEAMSKVSRQGTLQPISSIGHYNHHVRSSTSEVQHMKQFSSSLDRRNFLKTSGAVAAGLITQGAGRARAAVLPALPANSKTLASMPTRNLGKTGYKVGIFSLGGQAALERPNNFDSAVPVIERALDLGVNYIDTSSIYGGPDRWSEQ